jgi:hypothetical protein
VGTSGAVARVRRDVVVVRLRVVLVVVVLRLVVVVVRRRRPGMQSFSPSSSGTVEAGTDKPSDGIAG